METLRGIGSSVMLLLVIGLALGLLTQDVASANSTASMTVEETQATMDAYANALLTGGAYEQFFADDVVVTMVGAGQLTNGPAATKRAFDAIHHEQFDATLEFNHIVIGEGWAALEATFSGRHTGEFAGIPATGRKVNVPYSVFVELADGKITALRIYALADGLVHQLTAFEPSRRKNVGPIPY